MTASTSNANCSSSSSSSSTAEVAAKIQTLLKEGASKRNYTEKEDAARFDELRRIFVKLISTKDLTWSALKQDSIDDNNKDKKSLQDAKSKWNSWLQSQHSSLVHQLCDRIRNGRKYALRTLCGMIAAFPTSSWNGHSHNLLSMAIDALCDRRARNGKNRSSKKLEADESMIALFMNEFVKPYHDVTYMTFSCVKGLAKQYKARAPSNNQNSDSNSDSDSDSEHEKAEEEEKCYSVVVENLIHILELVPLVQSQEELQDDSAAFLFPPSSPEEITEEEDVSNSADGEDHTQNDSSDESEEDDGNAASDDDSDDFSQQRENKKRSKANTSQGKAKRQRKLPSVQSLSRHRRILEETWLAALRLPSISLRVHKRVLQHISQNVLPLIHHPLRFANYFTSSYDMGGVTSCLALHGLFILMTQYGLEYPNFYASLYRLITPSVFYAKYRTRFFKLLVTCVSGSQMLPAYLIAAMCKRLCRCALSAPPSGALFVLALVSNLLRRHKTCACIIHRGGDGGRTTVGTEGGAGVGPVQDLFDADTHDPLQSRGGYIFQRRQFCCLVI